MFTVLYSLKHLPRKKRRKFAAGGIPLEASGVGYSYNCFVRAGIISKNNAIVRQYLGLEIVKMARANSDEDVQLRQLSNGNKLLKVNS